MKLFLKMLLLVMLANSWIMAQSEHETTAAPQVKTAQGMLEGVNESGIRTFKGIPFAAPPVGELRWREPQPVKHWEGVRKADKFGPRAMQRPLFGDMGFRSDGMSEDCLYLNVWTPARTASERLPVMVYFYGGGFAAGDGSEPRYDGENMARQGIVAITVNYRLTVFGFFAHPLLTEESIHHSSGNYGLLDQNAALRWVRENIEVFGGDPQRITIAGESAGSFSVSAQMASPLSKNLIAGAIGESGSLLGFNPPVSLTEAEQTGSKFASRLGANSLADLRALPAAEILTATATQPEARFPIAVDGYFFPKSPTQIYAAGEQAQVPLLLGWNSEELGFRALLGEDKPTIENFAKAVQKLYGDRAAGILEVYPAATDQAAEQAATDLASDRFIGFSTWKWSELQSQTSRQSVYRYLFSRPHPRTRPEIGEVTAGLAGGILKSDEPPAARKTALAPPPARGAVHSAEIEYALGNLPSNRVYDWEPEDYEVSEIMKSFFANFIKTGNPNSIGLPSWQPIKKGISAPVMKIDVKTRLETEQNRARYLFLNKSLGK